MANTSILAAFERMWQHITAVLSNKSDTDHTHDNATKSDSGFMSAEDKIQLDNGGIPIVTTSGSYMAYKANVEGVSELIVGMKITIIPHITKPVQSGTSTLNVNDLGAKGIMVPISANYHTSGIDEEFIIEGVPVTLEYTGTLWRIISYSYPDADKLQGVVSIENGGTGAATAEYARTNLEVYSKTEVDAALESLDGIAPITKGGTGATTIEDARINLEVAHAIEDNVYAGCYYRQVGNVTQWINPPMVLNKVYSTTERYNGEVVKIITFECDLNADTVVYTPDGTGELSASSNIIEMTGVLVEAGANNYISSPFYYSEDEYCYIELRHGDLRPYFSQRYKGSKLRLTIKFI